MVESGVIDLEGDASKALIYGQMNEPPGARARVGLTGLTVAEYFRDEEGQDVLFFVDNIFRFTQAGSEVSALLGRIPSAVGYQPTLATDMGCCKSASRRRARGRLPRCRRFTSPPTTLRTRRRRRRSAISTRPRCSTARSPSWGFTPLWTPSTPPRGMLDPAWSERSITRLRVGSSASSRPTSRCRTSSPFSAWTNCRRTTS